MKLPQCFSITADLGEHYKYPGYCQNYKYNTKWQYSLALSQILLRCWVKNTHALSCVQYICVSLLIHTLCQIYWFFFCYLCIFVASKRLGDVPFSITAQMRSKIDMQEMRQNGNDQQCMLDRQIALLCITISMAWTPLQSQIRSYGLCRYMYMQWRQLTAQTTPWIQFLPACAFWADGTIYTLSEVAQQMRVRAQS